MFCLSRTGTVALSPGPIFAAVDSPEIRVFGKGGHCTKPHLCIDPILIASHFIVRLQGVVSCEIAPGELAIIICGSIHGGEAANIIPDHVNIKVISRSYLLRIHKHIVTALHRVEYSECEAFGAARKLEFKPIVHAPATINDPEKFDILNRAFRG